MQVVTIKVDPVRENESGQVNIMVEAKKGDTWNRVKVQTVASGAADSERRIVLQNDERLVIEGNTTKQVVYNRDQNMAQVVDADPEVQAKQKAADEATRIANEARERTQNQVGEQMTKDAAANAPKTNLGNPVPAGSQTQQPGAPKVGTTAGLAGTAPSDPKANAAGTTPQATTSPTAKGDAGQGQRGTDGKNS